MDIVNQTSLRHQMKQIDWGGASELRYIHIYMLAELQHFF